MANEYINQLKDFINAILAMTGTVVFISIMAASIPYILSSVGLYTVAKNYRLKFKWLAWVPIVRTHLIAELADKRRIQVGKEKRLETLNDATVFIMALCISGLIYNKNIIAIIPFAICVPLYLLNRAFSLYYFYRLCDKENATIYFILGTASGLLNSFFLFCCRDKKPTYYA